MQPKQISLNKFNIQFNIFHPFKLFKILKSKFHILIILFFAFNTIVAKAQTPDIKPLYVFSWDNDFLNIVGKGTDKYYSGGLKFEVLYKNKRTKNCITDKALLTFRADTNKIYSWSVTQKTFTPEDIKRTVMYDGDWPYAAGLYLSHNVFSVNNKKNIAIRSGFDVGVLGPSAFGGEVQSWLHGVIHYARPQGWSHQINNTLILNFNEAIEPKLFATQNLEIIGNAEADFGTTLNSTKMGIQVRLGKLNDYFAPKAGNKQIFLTYSFNANWVLYDAYLEGGLFDKTNLKESTRLEYKLSSSEINNFYFENKASLNLIFKNWSFIYTQTYTTPQTKRTDEHSYGNVSFFFKINNFL